MGPIYIFDLDGTIADPTHRLKYIKGERKDWSAFFRACSEDAPIEAGVKTLQSLRKSGADVWIWTGRSDVVKKQTVQWLQRHRCFGYPRDVLWAWPFMYPDRFRMRPDGDHRPDHVLKSEWLEMLDPPERNRIIAVFEDRDRVVEMWRDSGIACFQVANGNF